MTFQAKGIVYARHRGMKDYHYILKALSNSTARERCVELKGVWMEMLFEDKLWWSLWGACILYFDRYYPVD